MPTIEKQSAERTDELSPDHAEKDALASSAALPMNHRQKQIHESVQARGFISIEDLARYFQVTPQTIRRDINKLNDYGLLQRHHGGAGLPSSVENYAYTTRQVMCLKEKVRIARLLARHIPDKASLFINIGTTTEEVAKVLLKKNGLRIITNTLNVAGILSSNEDFEVIVAGGVVRSKDRGVIGHATIDFVRQFKVDFGIIGISGIDFDGTLLDFDYQEVRVAQAIINNSRNVFLAADHTKIGRNAMVRLAHIGEIDALFTDRQPPKKLSAVIAEAGVAVHVAE
jgi:DeoR family glycerol-3-phosphate regulon repressor